MDSNQPGDASEWGTCARVQAILDAGEDVDRIKRDIGRTQGRLLGLAEVARVFGAVEIDVQIDHVALAELLADELTEAAGVLESFAASIAGATHGE